MTTSVINQTAVWVKSHSLAHDGFIPAACLQGMRKVVMVELTAAHVCKISCIKPTAETLITAFHNN